MSRLATLPYAMCGVAGRLFVTRSRCCLSRCEIDRIEREWRAVSALGDSVMRADATKPGAARGPRVDLIIAGVCRYETVGELPRGGRLRPVNRAGGL